MNRSEEPIVFVSDATHFGGAQKSTILQIKNIKRYARVIVLNFYSGCHDYIRALKDNEIEYHVLIPDAKRAVIGGNTVISRVWRMLKALPEMLKLIRVLQKKLNDINPKIIWFNTEKSMFCVGRAIGTSYPTIMFFRARLRRLKWYCLKNWKNVGFIVANNTPNLDFFKQFDWARDKLGVAHNGIDFEAAQLTGPIPTNLPGRDLPFKVVMSATLTPHKAHSVGIKGFAKWCKSGGNGVMWICGDTPNKLSRDYENSLRQLCVELGIADKVHFLGYRSDVPAIIKCADVMLLTSTLEGLPRSILEAMALGLPIIATRVDGIVEVVRDGIDGILIDVGDVDAVAKALGKLEDRVLRRQLGLAGQERVRTEFTMENMTEEFLDCVNAAVKKHAKGQL